MGTAVADIVLETPFLNSQLKIKKKQQEITNNPDNRAAAWNALKASEGELGEKSVFTFRQLLLVIQDVDFNNDTAKSNRQALYQILNRYAAKIATESDNSVSLIIQQIPALYLNELVLACPAALQYLPGTSLRTLVREDINIARRVLDDATLSKKLDEVQELEPLHRATLARNIYPHSLFIHDKALAEDYVYRLFFAKADGLQIDDLAEKLGLKRGKDQLQDQALSRFYSELKQLYDIRNQAENDLLAAQAKFNIVNRHLQAKEALVALSDQDYYEKLGFTQEELADEHQKLEEQKTDIVGDTAEAVEQREKIASRIAQVKELLLTCAEMSEHGISENDFEQIKKDYQDKKSEHLETCYAIDQKLPELIRILHNIQLNDQRAIDRFFKPSAATETIPENRDNCWQNFLDLRSMSRYQSLIDETHIKLFFALVQSREDYVAVFDYLTSNSDLRPKLEKVLNEEGYVAAESGVVAQHSYHLLQLEAKGKTDYLTRYVDITEKLYRDPTKLAHDLSQAGTNQSFVTTFLAANKKWLTWQHYAAVTSEISKGSISKAGIDDWVKFLDNKQIRQTLRTGLIEVAENRDQISANKKFILAILESKKVSKLLDRQTKVLGVFGKKVNHLQAILPQLLENSKTTDGQYDDAMCRSVALNGRMLQSLRTTKNKHEHLNRTTGSVVLQAADVVQTKLDTFKAKRWFNSWAKSDLVALLVKADLDFAKVFGSAVDADVNLKAEIIWYIRSTPSLYNRLSKAYIPASAAWFGREPTQKTIDERNARFATVFAEGIDAEKSAHATVAVSATSAAESDPASEMDAAEVIAAALAEAEKVLADIDYKTYTIEQLLEAALVRQSGSAEDDQTEFAKIKAELITRDSVELVSTDRKYSVILSDLFKETKSLAESLLAKVNAENFNAIAFYLNDIINVKHEQGAQLTLAELGNLLRASTLMEGKFIESVIKVLPNDVFGESDAVSHLFNGLTLEQIDADTRIIKALQFNVLPLTLSDEQKYHKLVYLKLFEQGKVINAENAVALSVKPELLVALISRQFDFTDNETLKLFIDLLDKPEVLTADICIALLKKNNNTISIKIETVCEDNSAPNLAINILNHQLCDQSVITQINDAISGVFLDKQKRALLSDAAVHRLFTANNFDKSLQKHSGLLIKLLDYPFNEGRSKAVLESLFTTHLKWSQDNLTKAQLEKLIELGFGDKVFANLVMVKKLEKTSYEASQMEVMLANASAFIKDEKIKPLMVKHVKNKWLGNFLAANKDKVIKLFNNSELRDALLVTLRTDEMVTLLTDNEALKVFFKDRNSGIIQDEFVSIVSEMSFDRQELADEIVKLDATEIQSLELTLQKLTDLVKYGKLDWFIEKRALFAAAFKEFAAGLVLDNLTLANKVITIPRAELTLTETQLLALLKLADKTVTHWVFDNYAEAVAKLDTSEAGALFKINPYYAARVINIEKVSALAFIEQLLDAAPESQEFVTKLFAANDVNLTKYTTTYIAPLVNGHAKETELRSKLKSVALPKQAQLFDLSHFNQLRLEQIVASTPVPAASQHGNVLSPSMSDALKNLTTSSMGSNEYCFKSSATPVETISFKAGMDLLTSPQYLIGKLGIDPETFVLLLSEKPSLVKVTYQVKRIGKDKRIETPINYLEHIEAVIFNEHNLLKLLGHAALKQVVQTPAYVSKAKVALQDAVKSIDLFKQHYSLLTEFFKSDEIKSIFAKLVSAETFEKSTAELQELLQTKKLSFVDFLRNDYLMSMVSGQDIIPFVRDNADNARMVFHFANRVSKCLFTADNLIKLAIQAGYATTHEAAKAFLLQSALAEPLLNDAIRNALNPATAVVEKTAVNSEQSTASILNASHSVVESQAQAVPPATPGRVRRPLPVPNAPVAQPPASAAQTPAAVQANASGLQSGLLTGIAEGSARLRKTVVNGDGAQSAQELSQKAATSDPQAAFLAGIAAGQSRLKKAAPKAPSASELKDKSQEGAAPAVDEASPPQNHTPPASPPSQRLGKTATDKPSITQVFGIPDDLKDYLKPYDITELSQRMTISKDDYQFMREVIQSAPTENKINNGVVFNQSHQQLTRATGLMAPDKLFRNNPHFMKLIQRLHPGKDLASNEFHFGSVEVKIFAALMNARKKYQQKYPHLLSSGENKVPLPQAVSDPSHAATDEVGPPLPARDGERDDPAPALPPRDDADVSTLQVPAATVTAASHAMTDDVGPPLPARDADRAPALPPRDDADVRTPQLPAAPVTAASPMTRSALELAPELLPSQQPVQQQVPPKEVEKVATQQVPEVTADVPAISEAPLAPPPPPLPPAGGAPPAPKSQLRTAANVTNSGALDVDAIQARIKSLKKTEERDISNLSEGQVSVGNKDASTSRPTSAYETIQDSLFTKLAEARTRLPQSISNQDAAVIEDNDDDWETVPVEPAPRVPSLSASKEQADQKSTQTPAPSRVASAAASEEQAVDAVAATPALQSQSGTGSFFNNHGTASTQGKTQQQPEAAPPSTPLGNRQQPGNDLNASLRASLRLRRNAMTVDSPQSVDDKKKSDASAKENAFPSGLQVTTY